MPPVVSAGQAIGWSVPPAEPFVDRNPAAESGDLGLDARKASTVSCVRLVKNPVGPILLVLVVALSMSCGSDTRPTPSPNPQPQPPSGGTETPPPPAPAPREEVFVGAGDIGLCELNAAEQTAKLLDRIEGTVFTLGDHAYPHGTMEHFMECYDPNWGRHKARTRPSPGNHDRIRAEDTGYFAYFGSRAGPPGRGYYSYRLGAWQIYSLNSHALEDADAAQLAWLSNELKRNASPGGCQLAYFHIPVYNPRSKMGRHWQLLAAAGVELVLTAHEHWYQRFRPLDASFNPHPEGIRQIVAGTGGGGLYDRDVPERHSETSISAHGVLKLTLKEDSYDWEFVPVSRRADTDFGSGECH